MPAFYKSNPSHMIIENVELTVRSLNEDPTHLEKTNQEDEEQKEKDDLPHQISVNTINFYYIS